MSVNNKKISLVVSLGIFAGLVYLGATYFNHKNFSWPRKFKPLPPQSVFTSKGVSSRLLKVVMEYDKVESNSETAEVTATVTMPFDYNDKLNFRWKLGEGVTQHEGMLTGEIQGMRAGEEAKVRISVKGFSLMENHHIAFEIYGTLNGRAIHGQSLIASDVESTFENTVQNVEQIKASQ